MRVVWTALSSKQRKDILEYISMDDKRAAYRLDMRFDKAAARLAKYPFMGRPGKISDMRELVPHPNYRMVYRVEEAKGVVWIFALLHVARLWPPVGS